MRRIRRVAPWLVLSFVMSLSGCMLLHPVGVMRERDRQREPGGQPGGSHEHPKGSDEAWLKQMRKEYVGAVERYVEAESEAGVFRIHDEKLGKDWELKLDRIHKGKIVYLGKNTFFACADFKTARLGESDKIDLDFYATKTPTDWRIDQVLVHKVNDKPRYHYNEKNERVPAAE